MPSTDRPLTDVSGRSTAACSRRSTGGGSRRHPTGAVAHAMVDAESLCCGRSWRRASRRRRWRRRVRACASPGPTSTWRRSPRAAVAGGNPVIPLLAAAARARRRAPDAAAWVHRGATSQDMLDTRADAAGRGRHATASTDLLRSGRGQHCSPRWPTAHRDAPAVARTLTQQAVPTTVGLRVAVLAGRRSPRTPPLRRDGRRAAGCSSAAPAGRSPSFVEPLRHRGRRGCPRRRSPRGWASRAGRALAHRSLARHRARRRPRRRRRRRWACSASDVAQLAPHRGRRGRSVAAAGGSSAMPQKQNPVDAVLLRSAAMRAPGLAAQLHLAAGSRSTSARTAPGTRSGRPCRSCCGSPRVRAQRAAALASGLVLDAGRSRARTSVLTERSRGQRAARPRPGAADRTGAVRRADRGGCGRPPTRRAAPGAAGGGGARRQRAAGSRGSTRGLRRG